MRKRNFHRLVAFLLPIFITLVIVLLSNQSHRQLVMTSTSQLLSDPFLQLPTENSVRVVWFTDFVGTRHTVVYGKKLDQTVEAKTTKLTRIREDNASYLKIADTAFLSFPSRDFPGKTTSESGLDKTPSDLRSAATRSRDVWRHEAQVNSLKPTERIPYQVTSVKEDGERLASKVFSLAPLPPSGEGVKILLTSDHQLKPMTAANLQKVEETIGRVDAVFMAGDLVNIPDRGSEWFDDNRGMAFFPCFQGRAQFKLEKEGVKTIYTGGEIIQHAPIFTAIGNHEVMGKFARTSSLNQQFSSAVPRSKASLLYQVNKEKINPGNDPVVKQAWIKAHSFNSDTYAEIFSLPQSIIGKEKYYATTFGDIRLVVLYVTNIWRPYKVSPEVRGRYQEKESDFNNPENWGYGQHIFESINQGSPQYSWLQQELNSPEFQQAKYKVVMFHHPPHTLGDNIVPAYTNPVPVIEYGDEKKEEIKSIRYEYPLEKDYIINDLEPLLEAAGVHLVFYGHSHLWNRFISSQGMNFLESSNVGNSYGAYVGEKQRPVPEGYGETYVATGDPNGLQPIVPNVAPLKDKNQKALPYIASNDITVFSILDTEKGTVSSYRFDTRNPQGEVVKFDEFSLIRNE